MLSIPPICFVEAHDIAGEFDKIQGDRTTKLLEVFSQPRDASCKYAFVKWQAGYSPKEIYDMALSEKMLAIQHSREDADRQWRKEEADRQRKWQADQARLAAERYGSERFESEDRHRQNIAAIMKSTKGNVWSNIIGGIIAGAATLIVWYLGMHFGNPTFPQNPPQAAAKP